MKKSSVVVLLIAAIAFTAFSAGREKIKKSFAQSKVPVAVTVEDILQLPAPEGVKVMDARYEDKVIPAFKNAKNLKEGDLVTLSGYFHVVSLESGSNDLQIQITSSSSDGNNCLIVKVPTADGGADPALASLNLADVITG